MVVMQLDQVFRWNQEIFRIQGKGKPPLSARFGMEVA
jgi:hypothetical protein